MQASTTEADMFEDKFSPITIFFPPFLQNGEHQIKTPFLELIGVKVEPATFGTQIQCPFLPLLALDGVDDIEDEGMRALYITIDETISQGTLLSIAELL